MYIQRRASGYGAERAEAGQLKTRLQGETSMFAVPRVGPAYAERERQGEAHQQAIARPSYLRPVGDDYNMQCAAPQVTTMDMHKPD